MTSPTPTSKQKREDRQLVKMEIAQLDWIEILDKAIKLRPTSWGKDIVREWRNASDCVWAALNVVAIKKGIWKDFLSMPSKVSPTPTSKTIKEFRRRFTVEMVNPMNPQKRGPQVLVHVTVKDLEAFLLKSEREAYKRGQEAERQRIKAMPEGFTEWIGNTKLIGGPKPKQEAK